MADLKVIEEKISKGEKLTAEEEKEVLSSAPSGVESKDEGGEFGEGDIDLDKEKDKEKEATSGKKDEAAKPGEEGQGEETDEAKKKSEEEAAEKAKAAEAEAAEKKKKEAEGDPSSFYSKVEAELGKPDGQEDLSDFTDREKGLYYAMKKERKRAQRAEEAHDALRFEKIKEQKLRDEKAKLEEPAADDEEFPTKGELKKKLKEVREAAEAELAAKERQFNLRIADITARELVHKKASKDETLPDYDETMRIGEALIEGNKEYVEAIQEAYLEGVNPALTAYDLIRKDPRFPSLYKPGKSPEKPKEGAPAAKAKETIKKIDENEKKPKTSGAHGGGDGAGTGKEYTLQEIMKLSPREFAKLPKAVRQKFLEET